jgi:hypothetical protein
MRKKKFYILMPTMNFCLFPCLLNDLNARVNKSQEKKKHHRIIRTTKENEVFFATFILYYRQIDNI